MPTERAPCPAPRTLLIFGAGGHARVVADAAQAMAAGWQLLASDRNDAVCHGELLPGIALRPLSQCLPLPAAVHVAIGDNAARARESQALGLERLLTVVHPAAVVSPHATLAAGCFVAAASVLAPGAHVGTGTLINHAAVVDHDCVLGAFVHLAPGAVLGGQVRLGEGVLVGSGAVVQPGCVVVAGARIGAGAVVCRDITAPGVYVGVPARRIA
jgi:sugar O-acyltransferase (sialic acid O-acetyltransferase NeuD family)